jgi:hypothetical protein
MTLNPATSFTSSNKAEKAPNVWWRIALVFGLSLLAAPGVAYVVVLLPYAVLLPLVSGWSLVTVWLVYRPATAHWGQRDGAVTTAITIVLSIFVSVAGAAAILFLIFALFAG